jgi:hypothetical protein
LGTNIIHPARFGAERVSIYWTRLFRLHIRNYLPKPLAQNVPRAPSNLENQWDLNYHHVSRAISWSSTVKFNRSMLEIKGNIIASILGSTPIGSFPRQISAEGVQS